jgi:hypothetical protein
MLIISIFKGIGFLVVAGIIVVVAGFADSFARKVMGK